MDYPLWVKILAAVLMIVCTVITAAAMLYVTRDKDGDSQKILVRAILLGYGVIVGVWAGDKLIAPTLHILSPDESSLVLNMIKDLSLLIFGYYFGYKTVLEDHGSK
jgi:hypothetical protein